MSTFVVALTFLFVFSIKANASESYKVGDKVLFGDFGGHVIEDSDSNSNTVKVFVDGWNKTPEEWQEYWTNKFINSDGYINYSDIDMVGIIKNSVNNKNGFDISYANINDLKSVINISKYTYEYTYEYNGETHIGTKDFYYTNSEIPSWLLEDNYNLYGSNNFRFCFDDGCEIFKHSPFTVKVSNYPSETFWADKPGPLVYGLSYVVTDQDDYNMAILSSIDEFEKKCKGYEGWASFDTYGCNLIDKINFLYKIGFGNVTFENLGVQGTDLRHIFSQAKGYILVILDKSNIEIEKCSDYSENYKITYETNGGDKIDAVSVTGNKELTIPKREGYIFDGWYTDSTFKNKVSSITPTQKKTDTCIQGFNDVTVYAKWKKELTSDKVTILGEEKSLEKVSSIAVKLLDKVTANIVGTLKTFTAYDITLKDADGKSVEPSGKVKLSLEIPKDYDKNNIGVYREDGEKLIEYTATINGEYAEIETDHFSTYIVGEKAEVKEEEKTTTKVTAETTSKDDSNIQNPKTGDNMIIFFIVGILLVGGIAITFKKVKTIK